MAMASFEKLDVNVERTEVRLTKSDYSQVVFNNIQDHYDASTDIECEFLLPSLFPVSRDDWVGIFPVGWNTTSDKVCHQNVVLPANYQIGSAYICKLTF